MNQATIWVKDPLAIYAKNSKIPFATMISGIGIVIKGQEIIELVSAGKAPLSQIDEVYDASESVVLPGLINTHPLLPNPYKSLSRGFE